MKFPPIFFIPVLLVIIFCFLGCDSAPPKVLQIYWQLNLMDNTEAEKVYERLSLWVLGQDKDGFDDLEYIYLIHEENELLWEIEKNGWQTATESQETWIGTNKIIAGGLSPIPRGEYRVVLIDSSGERDERSFYISMPENIELYGTGPRAVVDHDMGEITVSSAGNGFTLWCYNEAGNYIDAVKEQPPVIKIEKLKERVPAAAEIEIYSYNFQHGFGYVSGPYSLTEN